MRYRQPTNSEGFSLKSQFRSSFFLILVELEKKTFSFPRIYPLIQYNNKCIINLFNFNFLS